MPLYLQSQRDMFITDSHFLLVCRRQRVQFERRETKRTLLIHYLFHPRVTANGRSLPGQESLAVHSVHMGCGFVWKCWLPTILGWRCVWPGCSHLLPFTLRWSLRLDRCGKKSPRRWLWAELHKKKGDMSLILVTWLVFIVRLFFFSSNRQQMFGTPPCPPCEVVARGSSSPFFNQSRQLVSKHTPCVTVSCVH